MNSSYSRPLFWFSKPKSGIWINFNERPLQNIRVDSWNELKTIVQYWNKLNSILNSNVDLDLWYWLLRLEREHILFKYYLIFCFSVFFFSSSSKKADKLELPGFKPNFVATLNSWKFSALKTRILWELHRVLALSVRLMCLDWISIYTSRIFIFIGHCPWYKRP